MKKIQQFGHLDSNSLVSSTSIARCAWTVGKSFDDDLYQRQVCGVCKRRWDQVVRLEDSNAQLHQVSLLSFLLHADIDDRVNSIEITAVKNFTHND